MSVYKTTWFLDSFRVIRKVQCLQQKIALIYMGFCGQFGERERPVCPRVPLLSYAAPQLCFWFSCSTKNESKSGTNSLL